jgi:hypothetical protein
LEEAYPAPFFNALSKAVQRHITESNEARAAGKSDWYVNRNVWVAVY